MPRRYGRSTRRRTYRRKSPWYNRKYSTMQLAAKAWRATKYLKGLVNSEMFHSDKSWAANTISNTGYVYNITALAQGDGIGNRTGNSILLRTLTWRLKFEINSAVTSNTSINMAIVHDTQQGADTDPTYTDIFAGATPESLLANTTFGRFKILHRRVFVLTPATGGKPVHEAVKTMNLYHHVRYNGTASTDIQRGGIYLVLCGSEGTNFPTISGALRTGYRDN